MQQRVLSAAQAGCSVRRWMCAAFLPYRALAHSVGRPIAVAAHQFLRYRGPVRNGNLVVFLPYRLVRELTVCCCAPQTDFLPCRIAEKQAKPDVLLLTVCLPRSELAQRYCAAERILLAYFVPGCRSDGLAFLRCRQVVPGCAEWQTAKQNCSALHLAQPPFRALRIVYQAAAQRCCAAVQIRSAPSVPVRCCCDTIFLRDRSAERKCAVDFGLPFFLLHRTKPRRRDSAPPRCCADGILIGNVRIVPAAHFA